MSVLDLEKREGWYSSKALRISLWLKLWGSLEPCSLWSCSCLRTVVVLSFKDELEKGANGGGPVGGLSEPKLASLSANSLPVIPVWAGTQMMDMVVY